jgi:hypothetical protein
MFENSQDCQGHLGVVGVRPGWRWQDPLGDQMFGSGLEKLLAESIAH